MSRADYRRKVQSDKLDELATLKHDWNSYGALPITSEAIEKAHTILDNIQLVPTVDGGIQFEIHHGHIEAEFEINPDGSCGPWLVSGGIA